MNSARNLKHMLWAAAFLLAGGAAHAELSAEIPTMRPGETTEASVSVSNPAETTALQFTITLPEGFSIPDGKLTLTERAPGHSTEINANGDREYKCVIYSASNTPIEGTSGPLFSFMLQAPASAESGDYTIIFSGIRFSGPDGKETSESDVKASVRVFIPVESISLDSTETEISKGASTTLTATVLPENATDRSINWTSDNTDVATVDASGKIIACGIGTATITATAADGSGVSASCIVSVTPVMVASIELNHSEYNMSIGQTVKLTATVCPSDAEDSSITWSSNNPDLATVTGDGTVTALAKGSAIITASANDASGVSASCIINIGLPAVEAVIVDPTEMTLYTGDTASLKVSVTPAAASQAVSWTCSDTAIATVTDNGTITAIAPGKATITATASDGSGKSATCQVTVLPILVASISLDKTELNLTIGEGTKLTATIEPENATDKSVTWSSDNPEVATVTGDGTVTAIAKGSAIITVKANDASGVSASCIVNIGLPAAESVNVDPTEMTLHTGETASVKASVAPAAASQAVSWTCSDTAIATVTADGTITAIAPGQATVTATTSDGSGKSATCLVTVLPVLVSSISLDITERDLTIGESLTLTATIAPDNAYDKSVTWSSDNTEVATVTGDGTVTALANGTAIITARANDESGVAASCTINVLLPKPVEIILSPTEVSLEKDSSVQLQASVLPAEASQEVEWISDDPETASVTQDGLVTALREGVTPVWARCKDLPEITTYCMVSVSDDNAVEINTSSHVTIKVERNEITVSGKDTDTIIQITDIEGRIIRRTNESVIRDIDPGVYIIIIDNFRIKVRI